MEPTKTIFISTHNFLLRNDIVFNGAFGTRPETGDSDLTCFPRRSTCPRAVGRVVSARHKTLDENFQYKTNLEQSLFFFLLNEGGLY